MEAKCGSTSLLSEHLGGLRQDDPEFEARLVGPLRPCLKKDIHKLTIDHPFKSHFTYGTCGFVCDSGSMIQRKSLAIFFDPLVSSID